MVKWSRDLEHEQKLSTIEAAASVGRECAPTDACSRAARTTNSQREPPSGEVDGDGVWPLQEVESGKPPLMVKRLRDLEHEQKLSASEAAASVGRECAPTSDVVEPRGRRGRRMSAAERRC